MVKIMRLGNEIKTRIIKLCITLIPFVCLFNFSIRANAVSNNSFFSIKYIDVGQGDSALVQCDGHYMLIDGGPSDSSSTIYSILKNERIDNLDYIIATHPDADHIGGLSGALNYAKVEACYCSVASHDTKTFESLNKYLGKQNVSITIPKCGDTAYLGSAKITFLGPVGDFDDTNNSSIVVRIEYGKNSFIFMGDAEAEEESQIIKKWKTLQSDVIKIGHHGSASSTSKDLLDKVNPKYAIVSVGKDNSYGHPAQLTLDNLNDVKAEIYRTDLQGDITVTSNGEKIYILTEKRVSTDISKTNSSKTNSSKTSDPNQNNTVVIPEDTTYVINKNTKRFHKVTCDSVNQMKPTNREFTNESAELLVDQGYISCGNCKPYSGTVVQKSYTSDKVNKPSNTNDVASDATAYVLNTNTKKFHIPSCGSVGDMSPKNKKEVTSSREEIIAMGYVPCKRCNP